MGALARHPGSRVLLALVVLCASVGRVAGKVTTGEVTLRAGQSWGYLSKFSYAQGTGNFTLTVNTPTGVIPDGVRFYLYLDEDWENVVAAPTCEQKIRMARWYSGRLQKGVPLKHAVSQSIRPHFWYFVLADCRASMAGAQMSYKLQMFNTDGSHLSYEDQAPSRLVPILAATFLLALVPVCVLIASQPMQASHASVRHLAWALGLFLASLLLATCHYFVYARDGRGLPMADVLSELSNWGAQLVVALELLSIAWAWTIDTGLSPSRASRVGRRIQMLMVGSLVVLHILLVLLGRVYDDAHHKYHQSETVWALGLIGLRLALGGLFAGGVWNLMARENNLMQRQFIVKLSALGGVYFISIPLVVTVASGFCACYLRHQVVTVGSLVVQLVSLVALALLLLTRNEFTELASLSMTSLPSFGSVASGDSGLFKKD